MTKHENLMERAARLDEAAKKARAKGDARLAQLWENQRAAMMRIAGAMDVADAAMEYNPDNVVADVLERVGAAVPVHEMGVVL